METYTSKENDLINSLIAQKDSAQVYMVNGIKLEGLIESHGEYHLLMKSRGTQMMVYKHAIATIVKKIPGQPS